MSTYLSAASIISPHFVEVSDFYGEVFDLAEVEELRSDIFRGRQIGDTHLGFSAPVVYELLGLDEYAEPSGAAQFLSFGVRSLDEVAARVATAVERGATVRKAPYRTAYGSEMAVLIDPWGHIFRISYFLSEAELAA